MARTPIATTLATATVVSLAFAALATGCKPKVVPDPQTKADLDQCLKDKAEKEKLIKAEEDENARLMREKGKAAEIVVSIEGNALTVKPGAPGEVRPLDDKVVGEASKEFLSVVERSRGAIQKCYEQALKKNTGLQAKTVTLSVSASFASGQVKDSNFAPSLGDTFDACIRTVASKWALPSSSPAMTFKAQVSLTPS
jgi:molybdopterin-biosynthesis enzyme MoeA-like protein